MNTSEYLELIQTLSQGSLSSVQSGKDLSKLDQYLHIKRSIEDVLCEKMDSVNVENGGIVLLVGSAGDGKSHLVSTIRSREEYTDFCFYNDATESYSPTKTAVDTLKEVLIDYNDENINDTNKKLVLNINHGKLNAFIEDDEAKESYKHLINIVSKLYQENSFEVHDDNRIKIVQFNNIHIFELYKDSDEDYPVDSYFMKTFLQRITVQKASNPFYNAYLNSRPVDSNKIDPVFINFELLQDTDVQDCIIKYIIEAIIRFKIIVTPREFQDFVYSILVYEHRENYKEDQNLLDALLPTLLFTGTRNKIQTALSMLDPMKYSNTDHDSDLALLFTSSGMPQEFQAMIENFSALSSKISKFYESRKNLLKVSQFLFRLKHLFNYHSEKCEYKDFLKTLQGFYNEDGRYIYNLYSIINKVIPRHYGSYSSPENSIPLNIQGSHYKLFVPVNLKKSNFYYDYKDKNNFSLKITLEWSINTQKVKLPINYSLYEYLNNLSQGRLSLNCESDKNLEFSRFIRTLVNCSESDSEVIVMTSDNKKFKLSKEFNTLHYTIC